MDNILAYMKFRADITFKQAPFNEADAMILSAVIGLDFEGLSGEAVSMYELAERYSDIPNPDSADVNYMEHINPNSLTVLTGCKLERSLQGAQAGDTFQFMRQGYFCADKNSAPGSIIFNRTVALNSSWK